MKGKVCACTGHGSLSLPFRFDETDERCIRLKELLQKDIEDLIRENGVTHFISGMALGVDTYFAEIVLELRDEKYPDITLETAIPCETQAERWSESQRDRYYSVISRCDTETLLQTGYTEDCVQRCDRYIVDNCNYFITVCDGRHDNAGSAVRYAEENGKTIVRINSRFLEEEVAESKRKYA